MNSSSVENDTEAESATKDKIVEGKYVLVQRGEQERIIEYKAHESIKYGKGSNHQDVALKNACGCLLYSTFRVKVNTEKQKGQNPKFGQLCYLEPVTSTETSLLADRSSGKDNRNIYDDNKSQPLGASEIATLRELGVSGPEILDTLVSNSKTFSQKTEFSQEKYLRKKEKRYGDTVIFLKPTISIVADYYFKKDPAKIMNLRLDSLSQMLSFANVHAEGKFIVYETGCSGLLVASVLHRLGGLGIVLHVHTGSTPQRQALFYMNFTKKEIQPLRSLDVFYLIRPKSNSSDKTNLPRDSPLPSPSEEMPRSENEEPATKKSKLESQNTKDVSEQDPKCSDEDPKCPDEEIPGNTTSAVSRLGNTNRIENEKSEALLYATEFDGLLLCSKEHPLSILQSLLPRLASSAPFAIFCQYPEPLVECYYWMKETNSGVNLNISENWLRNIQVDNERTHPEINMNSNGGYLLSGISVKVN